MFGVWRKVLESEFRSVTPYVCGFARSDMVHGCIVYTELAPRRQQFHVARWSVIKQTSDII